MSDETKNPQAETELVLDTAITAEEAPAAPVLTLDVPEEMEGPAFAAPPLPKKPEELVERARLTPEEQKQVDDFARSINLQDSTVIMQYGAAAQQKMSNFSEGALSNVRSKDLGEIGGMLSEIVVELRSIDTPESEKGGFLGLFRKGSNKITDMKIKYESAEKNVGRISQELEKHQLVLLKDIAMLDKMYEQNVIYFKELTMYILAGKQRLKEVVETELPALQEKARQSGLPEDAQAANDLSNLCNRFEKKLHDLELTRTISVQMAPQIRLIQNNDTLMSEKIQSTIANTIPLWKSQMVLALGVEHSQKAAQAQRDVTNMTNELLKRNSEALKTATIETAKESERGVVDIETLQLTNKNLIESLDEVVRIQSEGRQKRQDAEVELARIEGELKDKLLEMRS